MKIGPKYKVCKRLGAGVFEKCQTQKYALSEERAKSGSRARRGRRPNRSDFALQHLEKQRVRYTYGITEKQFSRYIREALEKRGANATNELLSRLESRLDNVVYRLGLAATRRLARQLVAHGHVTVNGARTTIPSYRVGNGDTVSIREGSREKKVFTGLSERLKDHTAPSWLSFDTNSWRGEISGAPSATDETVFDLRSVLEFYSR